MSPWGRAAALAASVAGAVPRGPAAERAVVAVCAAAVILAGDPLLLYVAAVSLYSTTFGEWRFLIVASALPAVKGVRGSLNGLDPSLAAPVEAAGLAMGRALSTAFVGMAVILSWRVVAGGPLGRPAYAERLCLLAAALAAKMLCEGGGALRVAEWAESAAGWAAREARRLVRSGRRS